MVEWSRLATPASPVPDGAQDSVLHLPGALPYRAHRRAGFGTTGRALAAGWPLAGARPR